jgi:hypothetical protein
LWGGGNFGVASSFEYDANPVSTVFGGLIAFALSDAPRVWEFFSDFSAEAPDELVLMMALIHVPDGSGQQISGVVMCHCGDLADGEKAAAAIRGAATPLVDLLGPLPYPVQNTLLDAGFPKGAPNYWKLAYFTEITAETLALTVERFAQTPSIMTGMLVEHFHGAVTCVPATATAFPTASPATTSASPGSGPTPKTTTPTSPGCATPTRLDAIHGRVRLPNYLADDDNSPVQAAYGPNWERLQQVKRAYDPDNVFHLNQNIAP